MGYNPTLLLFISLLQLFRLWPLGALSATDTSPPFSSTSLLTGTTRCFRLSIAALLTIANIWKQPKCPSTDEWIKKMWCIHTIEYYSATKKERNIAICSNMDGLGGYYAK